MEERTFVSLHPPLLCWDGLGCWRRIAAAVDETELVTLTHNTRPEATPANDRGRVADNFALDTAAAAESDPAERESGARRTTFSNCTIPPRRISING